MDEAAVDVVHITREVHQQFIQLGADEKFRQETLDQGISIRLNFDHSVEVIHCDHKGQLTFANGNTLSGALYQLLATKEINFDKDFRYKIISRFQDECPHDKGTYISAYTEKCKTCHKEIANA